MTRKEEIKQAAKANASQMCNFCLDKYCMEMCLTCPNLHESVIAFTDGVEWADQHPKIESLWHDVSEEPNKHEYILFEYISNRNELKYFAQYVTKNTYGILQEFEKFGKCRWAYISDLLPKGGEK